MNALPRIFGEAMFGLSLGIGVSEVQGVIDSDPAQVALVHGSQDAVTPAPPEQVLVHTNRAERRMLGLVALQYVAKDSAAYTDLAERIDGARTRITERQALSKLGR